MKLFFAFSSMMIMTSSISNAQKILYPTTEKTNVSDNYFGTTIQDPYRWLEDDTARNTKDWVIAQNKVTNDFLDKIPFRNKIKNRLTELWNYEKFSAPSRAGSFYVYSKNDGLQNQSVLYISKGLNGKSEVLLDPNKLSKDGTVALQGSSISKNQKYMAYSVAASGSDWQEIYVMDLATKKLISDKIINVKFSGLSWDGDKGFYYSGYTPPKDEKTKYSAKAEYQKLFYHQIGTPQSDDVLIYQEKEHPLRYVSGGLTEDGRFLVVTTSEGTSGNETKVKDMKTKNSDWVTILLGFSSEGSVINNVGNKILFYTNESAPNYKLVEIDPKNPEKKNWKTIIPESEYFLDNVSTAGGFLFANYLKDVASKVYQLTLKGKMIREIKFPETGTVSGFGGKVDEKDLFYTFTNYVYPPTIYKYNIATGKSSLYRKSAAKFNPNVFESKQVFYTSKDGTKVSMFIIHKKGLKLNGDNPTMIYAYGGFNINLQPAFSVSIIPFLENGGVYAVPNLRGGGEYGEKWHEAGMLEKKQNVFDDFIAAAEFMIAEKYTNSNKLAIRGGSNGGLLVGAVMTQRPELYKVAIPQVGVLDMLRYHKFTVGWGWVVEYGSSDKKEDFGYLINYSPLHNLKKGICYPATLVTTADHDDRVVPAHSFKFAATLQEAQSCDNPSLIRIDTKAGHGAGKPTAKVIEEQADIWSFTLYNMGLSY